MEPRELDDRVEPAPPREPLQALLPELPRLPLKEDDPDPRLEEPDPNELPLPEPRVDGVALAPPREPPPNEPPTSRVEAEAPPREPEAPLPEREP